MQYCYPRRRSSLFILFGLHPPIYSDKTELKLVYLQYLTFKMISKRTIIRTTTVLLTLRFQEFTVANYRVLREDALRSKRGVNSLAAAWVIVSIHYYRYWHGTRWTLGTGHAHWGWRVVSRADNTHQTWSMLALTFCRYIYSSISSCAAGGRRQESIKSRDCQSTIKPLNAIYWHLFNCLKKQTHFWNR